MEWQDKLKKFADRLASTGHQSDLYNPYRGRGGPAKRANLVRYLTLLRVQMPTHLLVGEAIGYRGGRMTGIPFTSEDLMLNGTRHPTCLGAWQGFRRAQFRGSPWREASATIVWETIQAIKPLPILWNALPFHPHLANQRLSNRTPKVSELDYGMTFLPPLLELFPDVCLIAVGRRAETALVRHNYAHTAVRHPSHGGKRDFMAGIKMLLSTSSLEAGHGKNCS